MALTGVQGINAGDRLKVIDASGSPSAVYDEIVTVLSVETEFDGESAMIRVDGRNGRYRMCAYRFEKVSSSSVSEDKMLSSHQVRDMARRAAAKHDWCDVVERGIEALGIQTDDRYPVGQFQIGDLVCWADETDQSNTVNQYRIRYYNGEMVRVNVSELFVYDLPRHDMSLFRKVGSYEQPDFEIPASKVIEVAREYGREHGVSATVELALEEAGLINTGPKPGEFEVGDVITQTEQPGRRIFRVMSHERNSNIGSNRGLYAVDLNENEVIVITFKPHFIKVTD